jgi:hypothetical protein
MSDQTSTTKQQQHARTREHILNLARPAEHDNDLEARLVEPDESMHLHQQARELQNISTRWEMSERAAHAVDVQCRAGAGK